MRCEGVYSYDYSFTINIRVVRGSERERRLLRAGSEYGLEPNTHLIDRILGDFDIVLEKRIRDREELAELKRQVQEKSTKMVSGK